MPGSKRVLIIGERPDLVDFSDPAIPRGMDAEKVRAGLDLSVSQLRDKGIDAELALTTTAEAAEEEIAAALQGSRYDCIVIGAGLRIVPKMTPVFEAVMNAVQRHGGDARVAFNLSPEDSAAAAERQLKKEAVAV